MRARSVAMLSSVALAIANVCVSVDVWADPPAVADAAGLPRVEIAIVGDVANADDLVTRIASWFRLQHVPVQTTKVARLESAAVLALPAQPGVHAWISVLNDQIARVFFSVSAKDAEAPRYLATELSLEHGLDEVGVEQLAQVVYLSSTGLWAGNLESSRKQMEQELQKQPDARPPSGPSPEPPKPSSTPAPKTPEPRASIGIRAGLEYALRWRGAPGIAQTVGGSLGAFQQRGAYEIGGLFHAGAFLPQKATASGVELETQGVTFALGATGARGLTPRARLDVEIGIAADAVRYRTGTLADASLRPSAGGTDLQPFAFARAGLEYDAGPVGLGVHALAAVAVFRTHYDVTVDDRRSEILVPWLVQPGIAAGASW